MNFKEIIERTKQLTKIGDRLYCLVVMDNGTMCSGQISYEQVENYHVLRLYSFDYIQYAECVDDVYFANIVEYYKNEYSNHNNRIKDIIIINNIDDFDFGHNIPNKLKIKYADELANHPFKSGLLYHAVKLFNGKPSLIEWMHKVISNDSIRTTDTINFIAAFNDMCHHLISLLSRSSLIKYTSYDDIQQLIHEMCQLNKNSEALKCIKMFNTAQRKLILSLKTLTELQIISLLKFNILTNDVQNNIIRKLSNVTDIDHLFNILKDSLKDFYIWEVHDFLQYIDSKDYNKLDCDIAYVNKDKKIVIVKVNNFETMKVLGRNSAWCISRHEDSWNNYCGNDEDTNQIKGFQYIFYNFNLTEKDPLSMIGFTLNNKQSFIIAAHNLPNHKVLGTYDDYCLRKDSKQTINTFLEKYDISVSDIVGEKYMYKPPFAWSLNGLLDYAKNQNIALYEMYLNSTSTACIIYNRNKYSWHTIFDSLKMDNSVKMLTELSDRSSSNEYIVYFDFNKNPDEEGAIYTIVSASSTMIKDMPFGITDQYSNIINIDILELFKKQGFSENIMRLITPMSKIEYYLLRQNMTKVRETILEYRNDSHAFKKEFQIIESYDNIILYLMDKHELMLLNIMINYMIKYEEDDENLRDLASDISRKIGGMMEDNVDDDKIIHIMDNVLPLLNNQKEEIIHEMFTYIYRYCLFNEKYVILIHLMNQMNYSKIVETMFYVVHRRYNLNIDHINYNEHLLINRNYNYFCKILKAENIIKQPLIKYSEQLVVVYESIKSKISTDDMNNDEKELFQGFVEKLYEYKNSSSFNHELYDSMIKHEEEGIPYTANKKDKFYIS